MSFYVTTPIYYVNDKPHIGHVYTSTIGDALARYHRLRGEDVFFLTGTDEHATRIVDTAREHGMTAQGWADQNAAAFQAAFEEAGLSHDDFIRTSEERHKQRVLAYVRQLIAGGDVYLGEYEGWYDAGQEEYLPETKAKEYDYKSPFNLKPLVRKKEKNYFFRLSRYGDELLELLASGERFDVRPAARKNEVVSRIREGLNDVPISRTGAGDWGIRVPGDDEHTIYVWIDALFNYLTTVDTEDRRRFWPADVHLIAKDILWFHAVIWPAMILSLCKHEGNEWMELPRCVYCHSFWIREGQKMSKSLGNFVDMDEIRSYAGTFGLDAVRYFLLTNGPLGTNDSDFAAAKFVDVYNADLANTLGNCLNRVANMTNRYFGGELPATGPDVEAGEPLEAVAERAVARHAEAFARLDLAGAAGAGLEVVRAIDGYIDRTQPFKLAKDPEKLPQVGTVLFNCAEALRIASVLLWPFLPAKIAEVWERLGLADYGKAVADRGKGDIAAWCRWGLSRPGTRILQAGPLFQRVDKERYLAAGAESGADEGEAGEQGGAKDEKDEGGAMIDIERFFETRLKVGTVRAAEPIPKSSKLLKLTVDLGEEHPRTLVAGIAKAYAPEDLIDHQVVVVANLKPAKLMGVESQGMVLAATADGKPVVLRPVDTVPNGTVVS